MLKGSHWLSWAVMVSLLFRLSRNSIPRSNGSLQGQRAASCVYGCNGLWGARKEMKEVDLRVGVGKHDVNSSTIKVDM